MRFLGYSTGAIALGDFRHALNVLAKFDFRAIELSALRLSEVEPLLQAIPAMDLSRYQYVSFHAPSAFREEEEEGLVSLLTRLPAAWPIVLHPDVIFTPTRWAVLAHRIAIENMDRRKKTGRSVTELKEIFALFPAARMCFDVGHARQVDPSMIGAYQLLTEFADRIIQLHVSEVDTLNRHETISRAAAIAFSQVRKFVPTAAALILESRVEEQGILEEAEKVECLFDRRFEDEKVLAASLVH